MGASVWNRALNTCQIRNDYSIQPAGLKLRSNTVFILSTIAIGLFTDLFLYAIIVPVLPFMLEDRANVSPGETQTYVSLMLAVYAGASVVFSPIAGVLADKVSTRQSPFLLGLSSLLGATVLLFLGQTVEILLLARVLQGMSSAVVWSVGMALIIETVGAENLGKTIGTVRLSSIRAKASANRATDILIHIRGNHLGSDNRRSSLRESRIRWSHRH